MTLKELVIVHDVVIVEKWWHTAIVSCGLYNLQVMVANAVSGKGRRQKPKHPSEFHPFIEPTKTGKIKVTAKTIGILKAIGNALCRKS